MNISEVCQVENTLYRLSIYVLAQGSDFFASTFSIDDGGSLEGKLDEYPIVLPTTITCAEFNVYLRFGVESVNYFVIVLCVPEVCLQAFSLGMIKTQPRTT